MNMNDIVLLSGKVKYSITLDPSVWIFDDRKKDLETFFHIQESESNDLEEYTKSVSKHWDREITEGAIFPPTLKTEVKFEKKSEKIKMLTGSFCMPFKPFLDNAEVIQEAKHILIETINEKLEFPLEVGRNLYLGFSHKGKPLREDGPIHVYFGDGSNVDHPIKNVRAFRIE